MSWSSTRRSTATSPPTTIRTAWQPARPCVTAVTWPGKKVHGCLPRITAVGAVAHRVVAVIRLAEVVVAPGVLVVVAVGAVPFVEVAVVEAVAIAAAEVGAVLEA